MTLVLQLLTNGLIDAALYALLGVGWSLIYGTTRIFHFAYGFTYVVAAYAAVVVCVDLGLPLVAGYAAGVGVAILAGCLMELGVYRPMRKAGATASVFFVASLGLFALGQNMLQIIFSASSRPLNVFPRVSLFLGPVTFTGVHVILLVLSIAALAALTAFLNRSRLGKAIRAVGSNPELAEILGISQQQTYVAAFALGSALSALAAVTRTLDHPVVPSAGMAPLFLAFIVAMIGGAGDIRGAVLGAILLGLVNNMALLWITSDWQIVVTFGLLLLILIVRPSGLFALGVSRRRTQVSTPEAEPKTSASV